MSYSQPFVPGVTHPGYTGYHGHWGTGMPYHHGGFYGGYHDWHHGYPYYHHAYPYYHHGLYGHPY